MEFLGFYRKYLDPIEKEGKLFIGRCPFHEAKDPREKDFFVNPDDGLWYCFSCRKGGNTFSFCRQKGMSLKEAPDYDPNYHVYTYPSGTMKKKAGKRAFWEGAPGSFPKSPYNPMAIDLAREFNKTLWICRGEKDTEVMLEAGELAIGIPSVMGDQLLECLDLTRFQGISEVILVFDHDQPGKAAIEKVFQQLPFAWIVEWPEDTPDGFDVADLRNVNPKEFTGILREWVTDKYPYDPLIKHLMDKFNRDVGRDPNKLLGYELTKFENLARNIDGVQPGFYVVAADTNVGKTGFLCNLILDLIDSNKDLTGVFFSLDDSREIIVNHLLSIITGIPLNQVQRPQGMDRNQRMIREAYDYLTEMAIENRMFILDTTEIKNIDDLEFEIKRRMNSKLFVAIDAIYNLDMNPDGTGQKRAGVERANRLKALVDKYKIPIICTGELIKSKEKIRTNAPPTINDLRDTEKFIYNANLILLMYPKNWENFNEENEPCLVVKYEKNKLSYFRGNEFLRFHRNTSRIEEL
ncbi:MAG: hypothetical protein JRJ85_24550 [Deltaproteobacteria bacterium]|nr:hypothetical protein [Deltaproteobacteria bacterium]